MIPGPAGRSAHVDPFCREGLPPVEQWPVMHWDDPRFAYPGQLNSGAALLDGALERSWGDRPCMIAADGSVSLGYGELHEWSNRIANVLVEDLGLQPGNRVLLRCFNHPWAVAAWFAVVRAGGVVVTTMPLLRSGELQTTVDKAEIGLALCDSRLMEEMEKVSGDVAVVPWGDGSADDLLDRASSKSGRFTPVNTAADDVALLGFTSGTTGDPKCTMHFHRDVLAIADMFNPVVDPGANDVFCGSPPLAFTFGLGGLVIFPMQVGASTVLTERPGEEFLNAISQHSPTICYTAPTAYRGMLAMMDQYDISSLRAGVSAGETLPKPTWEHFREATGVELIDGIGSTEMLHIFISASGEDIRPGATGRPLAGVRAQVVDDEVNPVPDGEVGLLAVQAPTGCRYLDDNRQREYVKEGWNLTGDAYVKDGDGYFWFQARADDMIISSGYNIAGPEVEASLLRHQSVSECAVIGVPDEMRTQAVKAFVVLRPDVEPGEDLAKELQGFVRDDIAPYKYPREIEFVSALPKTQTGKVQRYRLRELEESKTE
ncbi:MAG: AMP-binding protein [Acidimicrobiia bacterium]